MVCFHLLVAVCIIKIFSASLLVKGWNFSHHKRKKSVFLTSIFCLKSVFSQSQMLLTRYCVSFQARLHDESLRFVLSDQALAALASKVSKTTVEVYDAISEADLNLESAVGSSHVSPTPVVCSHIDDLTYLLQGKVERHDGIFGTILQKHLGPDGTCPLSVFNYALLTKFNLEPTNGFSTRQNVGKGSKRIGREASRKLFVQKFSCKNPVYHNCRIYANDGRLLCYCDRRKIDW